MRPMTLAVCALLLWPGALEAQAELDELPVQSERAPPRDAVRPRAAVSIGAILSSVSATYSEYLSDPWGAPWEDLGAFRYEATGGMGFVAIQLGVQTDWIGGYVLLRTSVGHPVRLHQSFGLVAEVTLFDLLQVGIGPSLDIVWQELSQTYHYDGSRSWLAFVGPTPPPMDRLNVWSVAPGFEARLTVVSGGGPHERRGFAFTPFFHVTVPSGSVVILAGAELTLQSY